MFITKRHLSRRTFIRGAGVTLALPFLESMVPAQTPLKATAATPKTRFGAFYVPHGATMYKWTPTKEGKNFDMTETLSPLEKYRERSPSSAIFPIRAPRAQTPARSTRVPRRSS
jgi:hypothetical protein